MNLGTGYPDKEFMDKYGQEKYRKLIKTTNEK
jgi:hypothetical protein